MRITDLINNLIDVETRCKDIDAVKVLTADGKVLPISKLQLESTNGAAWEVYLKVGK